MRKLSFALLCAGAALSLAPRAAANQAMWVGHAREDTSCRHWIAVRARGGPDRRALEEWALGYAEATNEFRDPENGFEYSLKDDDLLKLVDKQCTLTNDDDVGNVVVGISDCERELSHARQEHRQPYGMCALGVWPEVFAQPSTPSH